MVYAVFIFDGFKDYTSNLLFRYLDLSFLFLFVLWGIFYFVLTVKHGNIKRFFAISLIVLLAIQITTYPITHKYHKKYSIFNINKTNFLIQETKSEREQREAEDFLDLYLDGKTLYVDSRDEIANYNRFNLINCRLVVNEYPSDIIQDNQRKVFLEQSDQYYTFLFIPRYAEMQPFYMTFYMSMDYEETLTLDLKKDSAGNYYFLKKQ